MDINKSWQRSPASSVCYFIRPRSCPLIFHRHSNRGSNRFSLCAVVLEVFLVLTDDMLVLVDVVLGLSDHVLALTGVLSLHRGLRGGSGGF